MDQIRTLNTEHGQALPSILAPTFQTFAPLLLSNATLIKSIPATEHTYGPHPRQTLDLFHSATSPNTSPILLFLHGGGLIQGDKRLPQMPQNLVYANLGSFFAQRDITAANVNYRRVNSEVTGGGEDAVFPSGGEDVSEALKWVVKEFGGEGKKRDVFLMGNSAGGVHASTFILAPQFLEQRKELIAGKDGVRLRALINVAVPTHFHSAPPDRSSVLETYYGSPSQISSDCVYGLLEQLQQSDTSKKAAGIPPCIALLGEFDPEDEIGRPMWDFAKLWKETWGGIELWNLEGHNHISPPMALGSGDGMGEKWGEDVAVWIQNMVAKS